MNVKANMLIAALPEVRSIYVMPSASDESLAIGAALHHHNKTAPAPANGTGVLRNLYLGGAAQAGDEAAAAADAARRGGFAVRQPNDMNGAVAELLARGEIVATCRGRMEWGARALGNRSILAAAGDPRRVEEINTMIKMRDFWMPFAPSVLDSAAGEYFDDPKAVAPPFMTFAFPAANGRYADLAAASHPRDRTIRPQVVTAAANPDYHATISLYREKTGRGAILNTSFNLHGEPIVYTPQDALRVLSLSGLRHLALDRHIISQHG
jgi:carbamoyltransferase